MFFFSSLLQTEPQYKPASKRLFETLIANSVDFCLLEDTRDIWLRDFMPIKRRSDKFVSFRYEPGYLKDYPKLRTDFCKDIAPQIPIKNIVYSDINLDGGNVVFSPSKEKVIISDRIFSENPEYKKENLISSLENLPEAKVIIIESLKSDMTGHADGMVRFLDENTVIGNESSAPYGLESKIKKF